MKLCCLLRSVCLFCVSESEKKRACLLSLFRHKKNQSMKIFVFWLQCLAPKPECTFKKRTVCPLCSLSRAEKRVSAVRCWWRCGVTLFASWYTCTLTSTLLLIHNIRRVKFFLAPNAHKNTPRVCVCVWVLFWLVSAVLQVALQVHPSTPGTLTCSRACTDKPSRARGHSPSSPRSCCCLLYPWSTAHSSPSSRRSETASASSQVSCLSPWWSGRRTTCCPRRCGGTSCSSSGVRHREEAPVAVAAAGDPGAAAAAAAAGGDGAAGAGDGDAHRFRPDTGNHCRARAVSAPRTLQSPPPTGRGYWWTRRFLPAPAAPTGPGRMCWSWPGRWAPVGAAARCRTAGGREAQIPGLSQPVVVLVPQPCQGQTVSHCHAEAHIQNIY